jgi:hypothetical protein
MEIQSLLISQSSPIEVERQKDIGKVEELLSQNKRRKQRE